MGDLLRPVAEFESTQDPCGSYVVLAPLEGDDKPVTTFGTYALPSAVGFLALALMHGSYDDRDYFRNVHMKCDAFVNMRESVELLLPHPCYY